MKILNLENENRKFTKSIENFHVMEYLQDSSVSPMTAMEEYYMSKMNVRRRQVVIELDKEHSAIIQSGAMQWMGGHVQATAGIKGIGDGYLVLEPTYKYIILVDVEKWGSSGMTIEDGIFLACDGRVKNKLTARKSISSAVLGGEGFFNLSLVGRGAVALESNVPEDELIEVELENDELKIDGNLAVCWSSNLDFTVERSTKTLVGSAVSGEGLVNVYRGTGRVLMSPVAPTDSLLTATNTTQANPAVKNNLPPEN